MLPHYYSQQIQTILYNNVFIPDKDNIESLRNYLKRMKIIFSNNR